LSNNILAPWVALKFDDESGWTEYIAKEFLTQFFRIKRARLRKIQLKPRAKVPRRLALEMLQIINRAAWIF